MEQVSFSSSSNSGLVQWLLFDLNSFFASCEQQDRPELRGKPVAVVPMIADTTSVLAASYEAKKCGIKTGTRVSEARKLCPSIQFVKTRHRLYLEYHEKILEAVDEIIPIHSVLSVDEVACELTGSQRQVPHAMELARKLKKHVQEKVGQCLSSSVGIGPNTLIAKIASDMQKPDGLVCVTKEEIPSKMGELSVRAIPGIGAKMEAHLNRARIFKVSDLLKLTPAQAKSVWGSIVGLKTLEAIHGNPYVYEKGETKSISHEHVLGPENRSQKKAWDVVLKLLDKACVRLRKNSFRCRRLSLHVKFVDTYRIDQDVKFTGTSDTGFLMKQLEEMWKWNYTKPPLKVSVVLSDFEDDSTRQLSFFDESQGRREKAFQVADLLNEKYGKETVHSANLLNMKGRTTGGIAFSRVPDKEEF